MPLQNRVDPFGELIAVAARGTILGNRGGRFHSNDRTLDKRRYISRTWICCRLEFNGRHRDVWGKYYTELFFLDEVTAFAAGHRPCFECRRKDAETFAALWPGPTTRAQRPRAAEIDRVLHSERLEGDTKRKHELPIDDLPDGTMIELNRSAWAIRGSTLLRWTPSGYDDRRARPVAAQVSVLTPPSMIKILAAGFPVQWHPSALVPK